MSYLNTKTVPYRFSKSRKWISLQSRVTTKGSFPSSGFNIREKLIKAQRGTADDIDGRFDNLSGIYRKSQVNCNSPADVMSLVVAQIGRRTLDFIGHPSV